jgi:hypothetical protein
MWENVMETAHWRCHLIRMCKGHLMWFPFTEPEIDLSCECHLSGFVYCATHVCNSWLTQQLLICYMLGVQHRFSCYEGHGELADLNHLDPYSD